MKKKLIILPLVAFVCAGMAYFIFRERPIEVQTFKVKRGEVEATVTSVTTGTVRAKLLSTIASQHAGRVEMITKREGHTLTKGEPVIILDDRDSVERLRSVEAEQGVAKAELKRIRTSREFVISQSAAMMSQAKAKLDIALSNYDRASSLFSSGILSKEEMEHTKSLLDIARADFDTAQANEFQGKMKDEEIIEATSRIELLKTNLDVARTQYGRTRIYAPYDGIMTQLFTEVGEYLVHGTPVYEIASVRDIEIEAQIDEIDAAKLRLGQDVKLSLDAMRDMKFSGKVSEISPLVSTTREQNRTVNVKMSIDNDLMEIKVGMSADVEIITGNAQNILFIPTNAIVDRPEGRYVFVSETGRAKKRHIKTGLSNWETTEVKEGLREGEEVITSLDISKLKEGVSVTSKSVDGE